MEKQKEYTQEEADEIYFKAWRLWGTELQINTLVEEMAEFIHAYMKAKRNNVVINYMMFEELADVEIMVEQMKVILKQLPSLNGGNLYENVIFNRNKKLERLEKWVDNEGSEIYGK
jgi:adenine C2-methylase RlmN of 23S rRNA A2503 and tRNA A37